MRESPLREGQPNRRVKTGNKKDVAHNLQARVEKIHPCLTVSLRCRCYPWQHGADLRAGLEFLQRAEGAGHYFSALLLSLGAPFWYDALKTGLRLPRAIADRREN